MLGCFSPIYELAAFERFPYNTRQLHSKKGAFTMANMTISVNDNVKRDFTRFCDDVGLTASAVLNVCMVTIARERRIPFAIQAPSHSADDIAALESDIAISRREFEEGKGIPNDVVFDRLHEKLMAMKSKRVAI